jgi:hypothetical protein
VTRVVRQISPQIMKATLPQQWATRINRHVVTVVEGIVATGRDLIAAKKQLGHGGGWVQMFPGRSDSVAEPVRFSIRTADRFMAIANHALLSNSTHASNLPPSWMTLYELAKTVPEETVRKALADGRIHPDMQRREVAQLRGKKPRPTLPTPRGEESERARRRELARQIVTAGYRTLVAKHHPDKPGGSTELIVRLSAVKEGLLRQVDLWLGGE